MIGIIRKKLKKRGMQVIAFITLISLLGADFLRRQGGKGYQPIAIVNGYEITPIEFRNKVMEEEKRLSYLQEQFGKEAKSILESQGINSDPQEAAMDQLIKDKVILSAADKLGISLSADYISKKFSDPDYMYRILGQVIPVQYLMQEGFDLSKLSYLLRKQGVSISQFEEMVENTIKKLAVFDIAQSALYIPESVLKEYFEKNYLKKRFTVLTFDFSKYLNKVKTDQSQALSEDQIKSYFEKASKNKKYWMPEKRSGIVWKFDASSYVLKVSDREIENYYDKNKDVEFKNKKLMDVKETIHNKLMADKFDRLFTLDAQRMVNESRKNPEILVDFVNSKKGIKTAIDMAELNSSMNLQKLFSLKLNQKTYYVEDGKGYIVELTNIKPAYKPELALVKQKVMDDMTKDQARKLMFADLEKANEQISSEPFKDSSIEQIASKYDTKLQKTDWISPDAKKVELFDKLKIPMQVATELSQKGMHLMYPGLNNDTYIILLFDIEPFNETTFNQKKSEILKAIRPEQSSQFIYSFIDSLVKNAKIKKNTI